MSYDFRKIYNVAEEAGCDISGDGSADKNNARLEKVKEWLDGNFSDIFETVHSSTGIPTLYVYFKGTRCGIYIAQDISAVYSSTANGVVYNSTALIPTLTGGNAGYLAFDTLKLLVIKSKYGVIAGFFKETIGNSIRAMAINMGDRFISVIINAANAMYIADSASDVITTNLTRSSQTDDVFLLKFLPPTMDAVCDHAFWNMGASTNSCVVFGVEDGKERYAELQGAEGYNTVALELAEPGEGDFAGIERYWG